MVYDRTENKTAAPQSIKGYAIYDEDTEDRGKLYTIYTDDGHGNGDYICESTDKYWIFRVANALDWTMD